MTLPEVLSTLPDTPVKESLGERCASYLRDQGVPHDLIALFDECAYVGPIRIGHLWLSPLADLELENSEEENRPREMRTSPPTPTTPGASGAVPRG
jgi:hypothetical protein